MPVLPYNPGAFLLTKNLSYSISLFLLVYRKKRISSYFQHFKILMIVVHVSIINSLTCQPKHQVSVFCLVYIKLVSAKEHLIGSWWHHGHFRACSWCTSHGEQSPLWGRHSTQIKDAQCVTNLGLEHRLMATFKWLVSVNST